MNQFTELTVLKAENGFFVTLEGFGPDDDGDNCTLIKRLVCHSSEEFLGFLHDYFLEARNPSDKS